MADTEVKPNTQAKYLLGEGELLDGRGALIESGYAFSQVKHYDRNAIVGKTLRIKEWDYYCFGDDEHMIALTVADNSYMSLASVSVIDFIHLRYITKSKIGFMPLGKLDLPGSCESGDVEFSGQGVKLLFRNDGGKRTLVCEYKNYFDKKDFSCEVSLDAYDGENITVATPFDKKGQFYYNTKINCLGGVGWFRIGDDRIEFKRGACGVLDWGRGVWPYKNVWYWSSLSGYVDGAPFGFNLGYGFGRSLATENTLFYNGKAHKLGNVRFDIPYTRGERDYLKPWRISDDNDRLQLMFTPMIDRQDRMQVLFLATNQHQVFGKFYGKATLDDGKIIDVANMTGFAERVENKW